jgi:hypothetical protein
MVVAALLAIIGLEIVAMIVVLIVRFGWLDAGELLDLLFTLRWVKMVERANELYRRKGR